jgi:N-acetylglucosamine malate deacetylase 2
MRSALTVVAHPDDESFGLGAVLASLAHSGTEVSVVCFTHGEASTLGIDDIGDALLHEVRSAELADAAAALGVRDVLLLDYPDGRLSQIGLEELVDAVITAVRQHDADALVVFDEGGVTGHPDHQRATEAALVAADRLNLPVLGWAVADRVATQLNQELGTGFVGRSPAEIDRYITVDRSPQLAGIACHRSQSATNPVLWRRLELTGQREPLRLLRAARQAIAVHEGFAGESRA